MNKWFLLRAGGGLVATAAVALPYYTASSAGRDPAAPVDTSLARPTPIRPARVLIASNASRIDLKSDATLVVRDPTDSISLPPGRWHTLAASSDGRLSIGDRLWTSPELHITPRGQGRLFLRTIRDEPTEPVEYPGRLRILAQQHADFDVLNLVDVEQYVACVVAHEVWPTFDTAAFRGQAIVARSYVLYQMLRRKNADYDVSATQGSQVYRGMRDDAVGRKAADATRYTRGIVLTYSEAGRDRLFCTYYSAACGGSSQSAAIFGAASNVPPLVGGVPCDYCKIAPGQAYRWGPVTLTKRDIRNRLVARDGDLETLGPVRTIEIIETTSAGRAITIRVTGATGRHHDMLAERFRLAVGYNVLRSTHFQIRDQGRNIVFEDGRGFGHGLGLCQWGMQGQAEHGRSVTEIITYYYPGARLTRVY